MVKKIIFVCALALSLFGEEVSVFGAGNLDANNPYGLTNTEKHVIKNKKEIELIDSKVKSMKSNLDDLNVKVEGLSSITDSNTDKINEMNIKLNELSKKIDLSLTDIANIKSSIEHTNKIHNENNTVLKNLISELSKAVAEINKNYVSTKEFKLNLEQLAIKKDMPKSEKIKEPVVDKKNEKSKESKKEQTKSEVKKDIAEQKVEEEVKTEEKSSNSFAGKSNKEIYSQSKKSFDSKSYAKATDGFMHLVEKNYKAAESNYYLGLIKFEQDSYGDAIEYFRQSAILNDNATYMSNLLLKSAESFEKNGNTKNAKKFYTALCESYPKSKEADIATKKLSKLK